MKLKKIIDCACGKKHLVNDELYEIYLSLYEISKPITLLRHHIRVNTREKMKNYFMKSDKEFYRNFFDKIDLSDDSFLGLADIINYTSFIEYDVDIAHELFCNENDLPNLKENFENFIKTLSNFELFETDSNTTEEEYEVISNLKNELLQFEELIVNYSLQFNDIKNRIEKVESEQMKESEIEEIKKELNELSKTKKFNFNFSGSLFNIDLNSGNKSELNLFKI